jgi:hypothetical protein
MRPRRSSGRAPRAAAVAVAVALVTGVSRGIGRATALALADAAATGPRPIARRSRNSVLVAGRGVGAASTAADVTDRKRERTQQREVAVDPRRGLHGQRELERAPGVQRLASVGLHRALVEAPEPHHRLVPVQVGELARRPECVGQLRIADLLAQHRGVALVARARREREPVELRADLSVRRRGRTRLHEQRDDSASGRVGGRAALAPRSRYRPRCRGCTCAPRPVHWCP